MKSVKDNYVVCEGCDGVGKTTALRALAAALLDDDFNFLLTKEPGGPKALAAEWNCEARDYPFGWMYDSLRELCVNNPQIPQLAKRAIYKADSFYNWMGIIQPALEKDITVLSDRSWVSDIAYGTVLTGIPADALFQFNTALIPEQHKLTRVIYLDCPEDVREARLAGNMQDHMDTLGLEVRRKICAAYQQTLADYVQDYIVIDTNQPIAKVVDQMKAFVYKS